MQPMKRKGCGPQALGSPFKQTGALTEEQQAQQNERRNIRAEKQASRRAKWKQKKLEEANRRPSTQDTISN